MMKAIMVTAALLATAACNRAPDQTAVQNHDGRPGLPADKEGVSHAQASQTNDAALNSPRPNTLQPGDLVNSTTDVGGGAAIDNAPVKIHR